MKKTGKAVGVRPYHHGDLRRSLIDAALALVTEKQDWTFSLREITRRAGVSHNAPYNHFADSDDLLIAVAAAGFKRLRDHLRLAVSGVAAPDEALLACGRAYIELALKNPALYRLMCGPALAKSTGATDRPRRAGRPTRRGRCSRRSFIAARNPAPSPFHRGIRSNRPRSCFSHGRWCTVCPWRCWTVLRKQKSRSIVNLIGEIERGVLDGLRPRKVVAEPGPH